MQDAGFQLELSTQMSYTEVGAALARHLNLADQRCLRFTAHNVYSQVRVMILLLIALYAVGFMSGEPISSRLDVTSLEVKRRV